MKKVSIIIPVYNKKKTIQRCLESIYSQSYNNLEIIIIDDGSTDDSHFMVKRCLEKISKGYIIIKQTNQGPSKARNEGLNIATGDYLMFVDADDYLVPGCISKMVCSLEQDKVDFIECNFMVDGKVNKKKAKNKIFESKEHAIMSLLTNGDIKPVIWGALYTKKTIHKIRFKESLELGEDTCFKIDCILNSRSIKCVEATYYVNCVLDKTTLSRKKISVKQLESVLEYLDYVEIKLMKYVEKTYLYNYLYIVSSSYIGRICREETGVFESIQTSRLFERMYRYKKFVNKRVLINRIGMFILKFSKKLYCKLYSLKV